MKKELEYFLIGILITAVTAFLFYQSVTAFFLLMPMSVVYVKKKKKEEEEKRKWEFNQQFSDAILGLSAALNAGYSIENAFTEAVYDLSLIYPEESRIIQEFKSIIHQIGMNKTVESVLNEFANKSGIEDIENFAEVFAAAKRTGGDIVKIIGSTGKTITDKMEVKRDIRLLVASKQFEAKIMSYIPFAILAYLSLFSPDFLSPLYHNFFGIVFMSIVLIIYFAAVLAAEKIVHIEV